MTTNQRITPKIRIIIPVKNSERTLKETIDSVLGQTYKNYEIIVMDDGSVDNTQNKLSGYKDRIRYIYQVNSGHAVARNTGIQNARGSILLSYIVMTFGYLIN